MKSLFIKSLKDRQVIKTKGKTPSKIDRKVLRLKDNLPSVPSQINLQFSFLRSQYPFPFEPYLGSRNRLKYLTFEVRRSDPKSVFTLTIGPGNPILLRCGRRRVEDIDVV